MSETDHNNGDRPIAAEYVLGVLDAGERRAVERRLASDRALAREVEFWEARLGPLADGVIPITPPATTWWRIEGALDPGPESARSPKSQPKFGPKFGPNSGLWQSVAFWRAFAIGSSGFAAACFGALLYIALVPDARVPLIATINSSSGQPNFVATVTNGNRLTVVPAALLTNDPRAMELWLIVPGDQPRSLGLIQGGREVRINLPRDLAARVASDVTLAVSLEPPGGSPTGQPTGPVIATGKLTNL